MRIGRTIALPVKPIPSVAGMRSHLVPLLPNSSPHDSPIPPRLRRIIEFRMPSVQLNPQATNIL